MKTMFKTMKKPVALVLALMLVFSISLSAFAYPISATVKFYNGTTKLGTDKTATFIADPDKSAYIFGTRVDQLDGAASEYDAILSAASQLSYSTIVGWDANPTYGDPGGYFSSVAGYATANTYTHIGNVNNSYGYGWNAYIDGVPAYSYLTNEALQDGSTIEFKYEYYNYTWND
jgi:hypothetical protein